MSTIDLSLKTSDMFILFALLVISLALDLDTQRANSSTNDIKIGFLVGSRRLKHDQSYSRPGRQLVHAFNYGIDKINQLYQENNVSNSELQILRFVPLIAETFGNENESIKQTIELISKHRVNFIVGPQETCQVESRLASIFNVGMISHFCPQWLPQWSIRSNEPPTMTFIQTKPPNWKIVDRVVTLVVKLLAAYDSYPQQLVLLYFKESTGADNNKRHSSSSGSNHSPIWQDAYLTNDAIQYKLIGELLEIKLNELFERDNVGGGRRRGAKLRKQVKPLAVLNWHTTFHYGYTKNPFRQLIRRHLFQQTFVNQSHCGATSWPPATTSPIDPEGGSLNKRAAIYIVVGHYYEHLGLMLALNELNLLASGQRSPNQQPQSSMKVHYQAKEESVVIGVDIEQYDERDDSVRFLRGLLMDENGNDQYKSSSDLDSIALMYKHYMGVVPAKPTRMDEFLDNMRILYNQTQIRQEDDRQLAQTNRTLDSVHLTSRLFQFIRLPVEAFYLYDSIVLLGLYFDECIRMQKLTLTQCSEGRRAFDWFKNRKYSTFVDYNSTRFDSQAQTDGLYTLITRRLTNESSDPNEDDFGLVPVGQFVNLANEEENSSYDGKHEVEFYVDSNGLDPVWLPLWCYCRGSNISVCLNISSKAQTSLQTQTGSDASDNDPVLLALIILSILLVALGLFVAEHFRVRQKSIGRSISYGWFDENDESNFLKIVRQFLVTPGISQQLEKNEINSFNEHEHILVELHCHMFPFPSCKFVHWLTALYKLKEMMFQYQTNSSFIRDTKKSTVMSELSRRLASPSKGDQFDKRGFFHTKHQGTPSLKLLLNKYKTINERFCSLSELNHFAVAKLFGTTLTHHVNEGDLRLVNLIVEQPGRGNLRESFKYLYETLEFGDANMFKGLVVFPLISNLLDGLKYLHSSKIEFHGELRATTCYLTNDWKLKLSCFHAHHMRRSLGQYELKNMAAKSSYFDELIYTAPEVLENHERKSALSSNILRLADIYSFAFVAYELLASREPWCCLTQVTSCKLLVDRVKVDSSFRPPLSMLDKDSKLFNAIDLDSVKAIIRSCWSHSPERRPQSVDLLLNRLEPEALKISSNNASIMKFYTELLEKNSVNRKLSFQNERQKSTDLKLKLLPESIVTKLRNNQRVISKRFDRVSFCSFRLLLSPDEENPLDQLDEILIELEKLVSTYHKHIHLLDSQADSSLRYIAYSGEPLETAANKKSSIHFHTQLIASFAFQLIDLANQWQTRSNGCIQVKCGLHCGPVSGGLLSGSGYEDGDSKLPRYILIGPTMLLADTLESTSQTQRIQISSEFYSQLIQIQRRLSPKISDIGGLQGYVAIRREGKIRAKFFGEFETYWLLNGPRLKTTQSLMLSEESA